MPHIQALDRHVAELIAAGEVVERPASVVKELVENAVDAGSTAIAVSIRRGGMGMIRVSDDGCGVSPSDLPTAFLRHATSKVRSAGDLAGIGTLGFRGEALAAIAAVSRVEMVTRERGAEAGAVIRLEGGVPGPVEEIGAPEGTTITVQDLFFNTPARLKFMRKDSAETAAVGGLMQHLALSHPEISFRFTRDGADALHTPGDGKLESAIYAAQGREFAASLIPVEGRGGQIAVRGFITRPLQGRGSRAMQTFFVNGRFIKSQLLTAALEEAYRNQLMKGKFPGCVLALEMPVTMVDVNVHPAKTQVKFAREHDVFDALYHTALGALSALGSPIPAPGTGAASGPYSGQSAGQNARPYSRQNVSPHNGQSEMQNAGPYSGQNEGRGTQFAAASRQDFFQTMDAKTYREQGGKAGRKPGQKPRQGTGQSGAGGTGTGQSVAGRTGQSGMGQPGAAQNAAWLTNAPAFQGIAINADDFDDMGEPVKGNPFSEIEKELGIPFTEDDGKNQSESVEKIRTESGTGSQTVPAQPVGEREQGEPLELSPSVELSQPAELSPPVDLSPEQEALPGTADAAPWRITGELLRTYITCEDGSGDVWLIDKHAAHERVNFDRLRTSDEPPMRQTLLMPAAVELEREDGELLLENLPLLERLGFACEDFGDGTVLAREIPADLDPGDVSETLEELAADLRTGRNPEERRERVLRTMACKASIKGGWESDPRELSALVEKVRSGEVRFCPHGRPVAVKLTRYDLEKMFKRA